MAALRRDPQLWHITHHTSHIYMAHHSIALATQPTLGLTKFNQIQHPEIDARNVEKIPRDGMMDLIKSIAAAGAGNEENGGPGHPFYVLDLGAVERVMDIWRHCLPEVKPFFAVKCNSEPAFLAALARMGANFDCASQGEIHTVLALGVRPDRIIYANPCKAAAHIRYAATVGVNLTTFDSMVELEKIKKWHPKCKLLLRIKAPNDGSGSLRPLGKKFGALPEEVEALLRYAAVAGLHVAGVSFHVGSIAQDPSIYRSAIAAARAVFDKAAQLQMPPMHVLNIGGGFRATQPLFQHISDTIKDAIRDYFPKEMGVTVMAEPGRYFAEKSFTLAAHVIGIRTRGEKREYWIDDGIYGSFRPTLYNSSFVTIKPAFLRSEEPSVIWPSVIYGPSCDSLDQVTAEIKLPELQLHDLLVFSNMGAYSSCVGTKFNGFDMISIPTYIAYTY
ncbi:PREDICTED: ornithine decarboxylase-like isoform X2 [Ipomoea nil]|uniref:ornithine decarboxylase-like isoform X2 n=1 Tax=Ipomoea nil TaxID=35883 RepID=UPI0009018FD1|nr:PREDICTED: ornithine decarboxylase-like isoform X2 [Ipomoea nil]